MNSKRRQSLPRLYKLLLGTLMLSIVYVILSSQVRLTEYRKSFSQVQHPPGTSLVDPLAVKHEYYPATYADDSIDFETAYLAGELRSYAGNWDDVRTFYMGKLCGNNKPVAVLPLSIHQEGQQIWLSFAYWYVGDPSEHDTLAGIQEQYEFWGFPKSLYDVGQNLYLVYCLWS